MTELQSAVALSDGRARPPECSCADDALLLKQTASGDPAALAMLYDIHAPVLYGSLMKMLGETSDAEDILHDVFAALSRTAANYNPRFGTPVAWLMIICRRRAIDLYRRRLTQISYLVATLRAEDSPGRETGVLYEDEVGLLQSSLASLPDEQRQALVFAYFHGLTHAEIAERLERPPGTVKAWIRRGLVKLRETIEAGNGSAGIKFQYGY